MRFDKSFFEKDALTVAEELLGHFLVRKAEGGNIISMIVETEAYMGPEDKACHAYNNKCTERTSPMFMSGGYAYIYMIYGLNYCLNIVTHKENVPHAVLIRAVEPLTRLDIVSERRKKISSIKDYTNGPGKLAKALDIDISLNRCDVMSGEELYIEKNINKPSFSIVSKPRVNIDYAAEYKDVPWRKYIEGNLFISKK